MHRELLMSPISEADYRERMRSLVPRASLVPRCPGTSSAALWQPGLCIVSLVASPPMPCPLSPGCPLVRTCQ